MLSSAAAGSVSSRCKHRHTSGAVDCGAAGAGKWHGERCLPARLSALPAGMQPAGRKPDVSAAPLDSCSYGADTIAYARAVGLMGQPSCQAAAVGTLLELASDRQAASACSLALASAAARVEGIDASNASADCTCAPPLPLRSCVVRPNTPSRMDTWLRSWHSRQD